MFKNLSFTFFLFFSFLIIIFPSINENINSIEYCYSLEKIISRNSLEKSKNFSEKYKNLAKDISLFGTNKTKGTLINKMIDQYKTSKKSFLINLLPNQIYCLAGYWIEVLNPGKIQSVFYEKSKQKIDQYKNIEKEVDEFINDINSEYEYKKKEINELF
tara:strand:- start:89 stop:565 length:477 start_codon:yes stop_codon:yes gene_type:complete